MMNSIQIDIGPLEHERRAKMFLRVNKRMDLFVPGMTQSQAEQAFNSCPLENERRAKMFLRVNKRMDLFVPGMTQSQAEQAFNSCPPAEGVTPYSSRRRTGS